MSKIISELKRISRTTSMIIRAIELCFNEHEIYKIAFGYQNDFFITFQAKISNNCHIDSIDINTYNNNAKECISDFFDELNEFIAGLLIILEEKENEILSDLKTHGIAYEDSTIVEQSTVLMFKQIVESVRKR